MTLSSAPATPTAAPELPADPFRYGWRYVRRELPTGGLTFEAQPLTLDDVHYPQEGDFIVHSSEHERIRTYLYDALRACLHDMPNVVVLTDVRVAWDVPELRPLGPDVIVFDGVREQRNWATFDVAAEGARALLVIEITSPETRHIDLVDKADEYAAAGVAEYVVVDLAGRERAGRILVRGHRLEGRAFVTSPQDEAGRVLLRLGSLRIGAVGEDVLIFDAAGQPVRDYVEIDARLREEAAARQTAEARLREEAAARQTAEARLHEAEARIRELEARLRRSQE